MANPSILETPTILTKANATKGIIPYCEKNPIKTGTGILTSLNKAVESNKIPIRNDIKI